MLKKWLPIIFGCHCRADRSFFFNGKKFPICARCTGELVGLIASPFIYIKYRVPLNIAIILLIPLIIDGSIQLKTNYESTNLLRFITGILFGYALLSLFIITSIWMIDFGYSYRKIFLNN